jgi:hypothetical protein
MPGVYKTVITPQSPNDFLAGYQLALFLHKPNQKLLWILFELQGTITAAQLVAAQAPLEVGESNNLRGHKVLRRKIGQY